MLFTEMSTKDIGPFFGSFIQQLVLILISKRWILILDKNDLELLLLLIIYRQQQQGMTQQQEFQQPFGQQQFNQQQIK